MLASSPLPLIPIPRNAITTAPKGSDVVRQTISPYFFILPKSHSLESVLSASHHLFLEVGHYESLNTSLDILIESAPDFAVCLSTQSAYSIDYSRPVIEALDKRFGLLAPIRDHIETCLHEAVSNAIIHGNLGLGSHFDNQGGMDEHYREIHKRLQEAPYKHRRVTVSAWNYERSLTVSVTDQGNGFCCPSRAPKANLPHGRGLRLIKTMTNNTWIGEDKKTIFMTFNYH